MQDPDTLIPGRATKGSHAMTPEQHMLSVLADMTGSMQTVYKLVQIQGGLRPDTVFTLGEVMGAIDRARALLARDIDDKARQ